MSLYMSKSIKDFNDTKGVHLNGLSDSLGYSIIPPFNLKFILIGCHFRNSSIFATVFALEPLIVSTTSLFSTS